MSHTSEIAESMLALGRVRVALRDAGARTEDRHEAQRICRLIEMEIRDLEAAKALVYQRACVLAGHEV